MEAAKSQLYRNFASKRWIDFSLSNKLKLSMNILVLGGTRFFGIHTVNELLKSGHKVTIATRGNSLDSYGEKVNRLVLERTSAESLKNALSGRHFDVVIDKIAYSSNDIRKLLDVLDCDKYIYMSSTAVYDKKHFDTKESEFDPLSKELIWCDRPDFSYNEVKRQAECALWQKYSDQNFIAVRYPYVIGKDDYTKRLQFYVEHVIHSIPMNIDNLDRQMSFIRSDEAGSFMAFLANKNFKGAINGASNGTISIRQIINYIESKTGSKAIISSDGENAPYNGEVEHSINTEKARKLGFNFSNLSEWIYELVDYFIKK
jgi:nucleoside-diphosphate-sugar epimerase